MVGEKPPRKRQCLASDNQARKQKAPRAPRAAAKAKAAKAKAKAARAAPPAASRERAPGTRSCEAALCPIPGGLF